MSVTDTGTARARRKWSRTLARRLAMQIATYEEHRDRFMAHVSDHNELVDQNSSLVDMSRADESMHETSLKKF
jgi:hypothetical protein